MCELASSIAIWLEFAGLWSFLRSSERLHEIVISVYCGCHFSILLFFLVVTDTGSIVSCSATRIWPGYSLCGIVLMHFKELAFDLGLSSDSSIEKQREHELF